ncbi:MAG TPA: efflux RND transporter periplasmic adaptor subunit [Gemmatirosa sp.]
MQVHVDVTPAPGSAPAAGAAQTGAAQGRAVQGQAAAGSTHVVVDVQVPAPATAPAAPPPRPQPPPADGRRDDPKRPNDGKDGKDGNGSPGGDHPKPVRRRTLIIGAIVVVALLLLFLLIGILPRRNRNKKLEQQAQQTARNDSVPAVSVTTVASADSVAEFNLPGNVQAEREAAVYARATGYVRRFLVDIGQRVRAGQVLAVLDIPDVQEQLREARANESQAEATLRLARVELARWRILYRDSVITREELDQRQANYDAAVASVAAAAANVRRNAELVGYGSVIAPFTGIVTARNVDEGVLVSGSGGSTTTNPASLGGNTILASNASSGQTTGAGGTSSTLGGSASGSSGASSGSSGGAGASGVGGSGSLFRVAQADTVRLYVGVPQSYAADVRTGLHATVHVPDMPQRTFVGRVVRTAGALDAATRTLLTEVDVPNLDRRLLPGMYATVSFRLTRATPPVMIPGGSLLVRQQGAQAAVVGRDSVLQIRQITVGRDYGSRMEVLTGLRPGDLVVVNPTDELRNGQRVRPRAQPDEDAPGGNSPGGRPANPPPPSANGDKQGGQGGGSQGGGSQGGGQGGRGQNGGQGTSGGGGGGTSGSGGGGGGGGQGSQQGGGGSGGGSGGGGGGGGSGGASSPSSQQPPVVRIGPPGRPSGGGGRP